MFTTFKECCLLSEKQMQSYCSLMHPFEKTFLSIQTERHGPIIWAKPRVMVVYSRHTRVHGVKFKSVVLPNDLIIKLERQWEGRRHD